MDAATTVLEEHYQELVDLKKQFANTLLHLEDFKICALGTSLNPLWTLHP